MHLLDLFESEIVTVTPEDNDDMALGQITKDYIQEEIEKQLNAAIDKFNPHGWRKFLYWAREWSVFGAIVGVMVTMFGVTLGALYQSFAHVKEETQFRTQTTDTLTQIQATLRTLQAAQSPKKVLQEVASLDAKQFAHNLPALRKVAEQSVEQVSPSRLTLQEVVQKLQNTDENTQDYWPTVLQFLQFASAGLYSSNAPPKGSRPMIEASSNLTLTGNRWTHITLKLDGGLLEDDIFLNCRVIFTNAPVRMKNVTFINSVFEFPSATAYPSPYLQEASKLLLASGLQTTKIPNL